MAKRSTRTRIRDRLSGAINHYDEIDSKMRWILSTYNEHAPEKCPDVFKIIEANNALKEAVERFRTEDT